MKIVVSSVQEAVAVSRDLVTAAHSVRLDMGLSGIEQMALPDRLMRLIDCVEVQED